MSGTNCTRCGERPPGISGVIPYVGELKARMAAEICQVCWNEWLEMQMKVLNEYRLHMGEAEHRKILYQHAAQFLRLDGGDGTFQNQGPEGGLGSGDATE